MDLTGKKTDALNKRVSELEMSIRELKHRLHQTEAERDVALLERQSLRSETRQQAKLIAELTKSNQSLRRHDQDFLQVVGGEPLFWTGHDFIRANMVKSFSVSEGLLTAIDKTELRNPVNWPSLVEKLNRLAKGEA